MHRNPSSELQRRRLLLLLATAVLPAACGGGAGEIAASQPVLPKPKPRNAASIAQSLSAGQVGLLVHGNRLRAHPLGPKLAGLDAVRSITDGTGISLERDVERLFVTAPSVEHGEQGLVVIEHMIERDRLRAAMEVMVGKSQPGGRWIPDLGVPAAIVTQRGITRAVVAIEREQPPPQVGTITEPVSSLLIILSEAQAQEALRFSESGGLALPEGGEAALALVSDPHRTLRMRRGPVIPESIRVVRAKVDLVPENGNARVAIDALSTSPEQARDDAAALTEEIERVTSVRVAILTVRFFKPVRFRSEGPRISSEVVLTASELDRILGFVNAAT